MRKLVFLQLILTSFLFSCNEGSPKQKEVNIYTHRHYDSDQKIYDAFTQKTGIKVNVLKAKADELMVRIKQEGERSPADILFTVDAGNLEKAKESDLLQPIESSILSANVPAYLRDNENYWFAQTIRARVIIVDTAFQFIDSLKNYEDLARPLFKNKIVMRSSSNVYNQSLMASLVAHLGDDAAMLWAEGVVSNMAREPKGSDRDQVKSIASKQGEISVVNTYYLGKMANSENPEELDAIKAVKIIFPNQENRGTHINVSGGGVAKYAPNKENAIKLLEFLSEIEAQEILSTANYEYPVNSNVKPESSFISLENIKTDEISLSILGKNNATAVKLFDKAQWK